MYKLKRLLFTIMTAGTITTRQKISTQKMNTLAVSNYIFLNIKSYIMYRKIKTEEKK